jgi:hypothetical protein
MSNFISSFAKTLAICDNFLVSNLLLTKVIALAALFIASPNSFNVEHDEIRIETADN